MTQKKSLSDLPSDAQNILQTIASRWGTGCDELQVLRLKGAMTNEVYQIKWPGVMDGQDRPRKVLVRIYGEGVEVFFDREDETRTFEFMSSQGAGPQLLARFSNGRVEEFIHARTLSACDLRDPDISALIAVKMKEFHDLEMPGSRKVLVWDRLRQWLDAAESMASPEEVQEFRLDSLNKEISLLEKLLSKNSEPVGFCHNDLQYGNIMINEQTMSITIIDFEYASYNAVAYDIANHFCEMAADYHTETPHILDYSKYPGLEERKHFLHNYLRCSGNQFSDEGIEQLLQDVEKYTLVSHLLWGLWGIISEHVNEIDFDYMEYARQRLQQYRLRKPELLESPEINSNDLPADGNNETT